MPDIQNLTITPAAGTVTAGAIVVLTAGIVAALSPAQKTALLPFIVPDVNISCLVTDSQTGATLTDLSASFSLWDAFRQLTGSQRQEILDRILHHIILRKAGV